MTTPASVPAPATVLVFLDPGFENGRIADASKPQLMATDQGATRGDGVFESLLAVGGTPRKLAAHLNRLAGSVSSAVAISDSTGVMPEPATTAA